MYRDSVEIDELKYPLLIKTMRLVAGSGGAGKFRGSPKQEVIYGPRLAEMTAIIPCDGQVFSARGALGGHDGSLGASFLIDADGKEKKLPNITTVTLKAGEWLRGLDTSGGGYGDPLERSPEAVWHDVVEGWETWERAFEVYGLVLDHDGAGELVIDQAATAARRRELKRRKMPAVADSRRPERQS
jgi:N-methylhydantoinase B